MHSTLWRSVVIVEQVALVAAAARVADHPGRAAGQRERTMAGELEAAQMNCPTRWPDVQRVGRGVEADVQPDRPLARPRPACGRGRSCRGRVHARASSSSRSIGHVGRPPRFRAASEFQSRTGRTFRFCRDDRAADLRLPPAPGSLMYASLVERDRRLPGRPSRRSSTAPEKPRLRVPLFACAHWPLASTEPARASPRSTRPAAKTARLPDLVFRDRRRARDEPRRLLDTRSAQTNEVGRCAASPPGPHHPRRHGGPPGACRDREHGRTRFAAAIATSSLRPGEEASAARRPSCSSAGRGGDVPIPRGTHPSPPGSVSTGPLSTSPTPTRRGGSRRACGPTNRNGSIDCASPIARAQTDTPEVRAGDAVEDLAATIGRWSPIRATLSSSTRGC